MLKLLGVACACGVLALGISPAAAVGDDESWDMWEIRQILEAEWKRSREAKEAAAREGREGEILILPPITSYHDIPGNEAQLINQPDDRQ